MQTVHVRVNDAATGKPTACRVRFTDAGGKYHAPLGRRAEFLPSCAMEGNFRDGEEAWAYIDGSCEILLPPGRISVAIRKGIEYTPLDTALDLLPGKLAMRFTLERWTDWRKAGWYSGDGRVHYKGPHEVLLEAAGEDLAVVNLLAEETPSGNMPNIVAFSGQKPCLEIPGHMVVVNTCNVYPDWGSLALLNCHRVVYPLRLGREGQPDWTLSDWCDQCHRKQGLVVWSCQTNHQHRLVGEALADLVLGKIDAVEFTHLGPAPGLKEVSWETLLDAGFRIPLMGSSGSHGGKLLGRPRTYGKLESGEALTYRNWIEALRSGRTFVTMGPLVDFTVNGQKPGSVIELSEGGRNVSVQAEVHSLPVHFETLELICNGQPIHQARPGQQATPDWTARLSEEVSVPEGGWLVAQCWGRDNQILARTSPVYVKVPGKVPPQQNEARQQLAGCLNGLLVRAQEERAVNERLVHVLKNACDKIQIPR